MGRVKITSKERTELDDLREKTGVGPMRLLKGRRDIPDGLDSAIIQTWLNGKTTSAPQGHLEYVRNLWRTHPRRIPLTPDMQTALIAEYERTGVGYKNIRLHIPDRPKKLSGVTISRWANGRVAKIDETMWRAVMAAYASLPDARG